MIKFISGTAFEIEMEKDKEITREPIYSLVPYMQEIIELEEDTLFSDIWKYIKKDAKLIQIFFNGSLGNFDIKQYIDQSKKPGKSIEERSDPNNYIDHIEIYWNSDANCWNKELEEQNLYDFELSSEIYGIGPQTFKLDEKELIEKNQKWALDLTPINDLMELEIKLNKIFVINISKKNETNKNSSITYKKDFTVYDVINAILFEISYFGTPTEQMRTMFELEQKIAEIKNR